MQWKCGPAGCGVTITLGDVNADDSPTVCRVLPVDNFGVFVDSVAFGGGNTLSVDKLDVYVLYCVYS